MTLALALVGGFGVRVFRLDVQSFWYDEGYSIQLARLDWEALPSAIAADVHPPLYYYLLKPWIALSGIDEFSVRYLSVILGLLTVPLIYALAEQLFDRRVALIACVLAAFSPFYVHYSQEARMYSLLAVSSALAFYCFLRAWRTHTAGWWCAYVLAMSASLYSHLYATLIFAVANVAFLVWLGSATVRQRWGLPAKSMRNHLLAQAAVALLFLPGVQVASQKLATYATHEQGSGLDWILAQTAIVFSLGHEVLGIATFPGHPDFGRDWGLALALTAPFALVALIGAVVGSNTRQASFTRASPPKSQHLTDGRVLTSLYLIVPLCVVVILSAGQRDFNARYLIAASPAYYILVAAGLATFARPRARRVIVTAVAAVTFLAAWVYALDNYFFEPKYSRDDHRSAVAYIERRWVPGDLVVLDAHFEQVFEYYAGSRLEWVRFPETLPADHAQSVAALANLTARYNRIWLVMWGDYFEDPDRVVQRWLDEHAYRADGIAFAGPVIVYGYLTESPVREQPARPSVLKVASFADRLVLRGYDSQIVERSQGTAIYVDLYWEALQKMPVNYSIFVHVVNAQGQMVGVGDSQPINGYLPTSQWQPGKVIRSGIDVVVKPGTPPGRYRLIAGVYDQATMARLPTDQSDAVELGEVTLSAHTFDKKALDYRPAGARYGNVAELLGYQLTRPTRDTITVTLYWRALQKQTRRFSVFNHVVDKSGNIVAQRDGEPGAGMYPTDQWQPGEIVRDEYTIRLGNNADGELRLLTGMYDSVGGERLTIDGVWPFSRQKSAYEVGIVG